MISSNSTWDRGSFGRSLSPAFSRGVSKLFFEFENRKTSKIFSHSLGRVDFQSGLEEKLNSSRDRLIVDNFDKRDVSGYIYKSVSHSHLPEEIFSQEENGIPIHAHGYPVKGGRENCLMIGSTCSEGESDTRCNSGKCKIGFLSRVFQGKWRYDSLTVPGLYYFVLGTDSVTLRSVTKGKFNLPSGSGSVDVNRIASVPVKVYLPPSTYLEEDFVRKVIRRLDVNGEVRSLRDSANDFIRFVLGTNSPSVWVEEEVKNRLLSSLKKELSQVWHSQVEKAIEVIWLKRRTKYKINNRQFAIECYGVLSELYQKAIVTGLSSFKGSKVSIDDQIGRPVYGRLPGVSGAYNNESKDTASKWLTSGADTELSLTKTSLDRFYSQFLDPETCYPLHLDWLAQHMGFTGSLWNQSWSNFTKRLVLKNAHVNLLEGGMWTNESANDTLRRIDKGRIERTTLNAETGEVSMSYRYTSRQYDQGSQLMTLSTFNDLIVDSSNWQGILPSRGNLMTLLFMFWAMGIKASSPAELRYNKKDNTFLVRSGLRELEFASPVNMPYIVDVLRVGDESDAEVGNYGNQLVADVSTCQDDDSANMVVVRMPFYYNRNGRSWDSAQQVVENYIPSTSEKKIQYAYAASDLLVADDIFFEPVIDDSRDFLDLVPSGGQVILFEGIEKDSYLISESDEVLLADS